MISGQRPAEPGDAGGNRAVYAAFFSNAQGKVFHIDAPVFWRTVWLIPAFTTAIVLTFTARFDPENVQSFGFLFARTLLLLCVIVFYSILLDALDGIRRQTALAEQAATQEQLLHLQKRPYEQLLKHMEEVKAARHDLRQHLSVMGAYLETGDLEGLKGYLEVYERGLPTDIRRVFAKNFAVNAVCAYYAEEVRKFDIEYDVSLDMPECLPVSEPELCALLRNLLENAVEGWRDVPEPFIRLRGSCDGNHVVITMDNSCGKEPVWVDEKLLSSKHEGFGIGTRVVREMAERCGGAGVRGCGGVWMWGWSVFRVGDVIWG